MKNLPDPEFYKNNGRDWVAWGKELVSRFEKPGVNKAPQLPSYSSTNLPSAADNGVLIYISDAERIAYSQDGVWRELLIGGPFEQNVRTIAFAQSPYTVQETDTVIRVNAVGGAVVVLLPSLSVSDGRELRVKKLDASANNVTLTANGVDLIDGLATLAWNTQYQAYSIQGSSGAEWGVV